MDGAHVLPLCRISWEYAFRSRQHRCEALTVSVMPFGQFAPDVSRDCNVAQAMLSPADVISCGYKSALAQVVARCFRHVQCRLAPPRDLTAKRVHRVTTPLTRHTNSPERESVLRARPNLSTLSDEEHPWRTISTAP
jgi:hypothetical protein